MKKISTDFYYDRYLIVITKVVVHNDSKEMIAPHLTQDEWKESIV